MKLLLITSLTLLFISCSSNDSEEKPETKQNNTQDTIQVVDTIAQLDSVILDSVAIVTSEPVKLSASQQKFFDDTIQKFLKPEDIDYLYFSMNSREQIKTVEDMHKYYAEILPNIAYILSNAMYESFPEVEYAGDDSPAIGWRSISKFIPELYADCPCSECTSTAYVELNAMYDLAQNTPGEEDDYFFIMQKEIYEGNFIGETYDKEFTPVLDGHSSGFSIVDHCDVCSFLTFGNDFHYRMHEYILTHTWSIFQSEVDDLYTRDYLTNDNLVFYYEKEAVIVEMHDLQTLDLPKPYRKLIDAGLARVQNDTNVYFGCQNWENNCPTPW